MISSDEKLVLRDFSDVAKKLDVPFLVVGAGARLLMLDWKYQLSSSRTTIDWDIAVSVSDWDEFRELRGALTAEPDARFFRTSVEHRLKHISGIPIDIIPFGSIEQEGKITWPEDASIMEVIGFKEVHSSAQWFALEGDFGVLVATPAGLAFLKIFSFFERRRNDDLRDLYFIARHYAEAGNEDRIFDQLYSLLSEGSIRYDIAGAYLLGRDMQRILSMKTKELAAKLLTNLTDPYCRDFDLLLERFGDEREEERSRNAIAEQFAALRAGLESRRQ